MYYVNDKPIDLAALSPHAPEAQKNKYPNEIESMIMTKWRELKDRYSPSGEKLTFVCPAIKSGVGVGNMGGSFDRTVIVQTPTGTQVVVWCETAIPIGNGRFSFKPIKYRHSPENKNKVLDLTKDIEEIIWLSLFDPYAKQHYTFPAKDETGSPHPMAGKTVKKVYLLDRNEEASDFLAEVSKSSDVKFYLTSERSPIIKNRDLINTLASAWGVTKPENKTDAIVRMELLQAIENNEKLHNEEWGYDGFCDKVSNLIESGEDPKTETMALISKSVDRGIVKYSNQKLSWFLLNDGGTELKKLCGVSPSESERQKDALCKHLLHNQDDMSILQGSVDDKPLYKKQPLKVYIPRPVTEAWFREEMPFPKMKTACNIIGINPFGRNKTQLEEILINHFIVKKLFIPDENLLEKP